MHKLNKYYHQECPICMEVVYLKEMLHITPCCFKLIHLSCLKKWTNKSNNYKCILCNQLSNKFNFKQRDCC